MAFSSSSPPSMAASFLLLLSVILLQSASGSSLSCLPHPPSFLFNLQSQCPISIPSNPPLQVDGNFIEGVLSGRKRIEYISILFYASWCPFSHKMLPKFEVLSSMFPQVEHLVLEQSSALPSLYSKYGIHSLPTILLVNQTSRLRYHGPNNLLSLSEFFEKNTGFEVSSNIAVGQLSSLMSDENSISNPLMALSLKETMNREPYLLLSVLFLCLRLLLFVFPKILSRIRAFWVSCIPQLNMQIFGETSQVMGRVLQVIDVRRIWTKLRLCKTRNFHERARSARVWASSLASVSLGESSSARSSTQGLN
ncbi:5'-adenylylsulfate reductase-like 5 isoform X2 [Abrus precatorius]|uniref:5'-adenylylsulfate reductase-like 5 isoform X2 n=1 Tax=Abrus precatorius TaxID=3816 RepID=A0A8B8LW48_ABRPR|nr:5'-adenylylsulfate reductase-like 5 isoform X2 [Abrus precatorius]